MCNFHESVAVLAATDPVTGKVHAGHKAVIRVALSRYWASGYVDGAENVDGYNFYPLATKEQQAAFERSGLKRPIASVQEEERTGIAFLREKILELSQHQDLSPNGLKLPLPTARDAYMDYAIDRIYTGYPKAGLSIVDKVEREELNPLLAAVSFLHSDPKTSLVLEQLVKGKICTLYSEAPDRVNMSLVRAYESLPPQVKDVASSLGRYGSSFALGGFSGLVGHGVHYGSVLGAGLAAGTASSLNMALSGVFLVACYGGWRQAFGGQYRAVKEQAAAFVVQAALTFAAAVGVQQLIPHDHMDHEQMGFYNSLSREGQNSMANSMRGTFESLPEDLQRRLEVRARESNVPPEILLVVDRKSVV